MKKILVLTVYICLTVLLSADLPPQRMDVVFVPDSFVRVGFSDDPVYNSVQPDYMAPSVGLEFYDSEDAIHTDKDNLYLYTQIFTTYPMLVEITVAKKLSGDPSDDSSYGWHADFTPVEESEIMQTGTISSTDNDDGVLANPPRLVEEADSTVDLSKPRTYCWNLVVNLNKDDNGKLPSAPEYPVSGSMTVNVRSV